MTHPGYDAPVDELPTGRDDSPPEEPGGLGEEPGRERGSDTPHPTRGSAAPDPERASGGHASFDPDVAEGGVLPHTDALDPPDAGVPLAPEGSGAARASAPGAERGAGTVNGGIGGKRTDGTSQPRDDAS